jgi:hypothetical protein
MNTTSSHLALKPKIASAGLSRLEPTRPPRGEFAMQMEPVAVWEESASGGC